jgi:hypothetical protein
MYNYYSYPGYGYGVDAPTTVSPPISASPTPSIVPLSTHPSDITAPPIPGIPPGPAPSVPGVHSGMHCGMICIPAMFTDFDLP